MLIEQLIGDLLLRHNCVVVPAFGGFVARQTSAVLDAANGVMLPPRKSLLFNKQLINNDGLLIASLAKETGRSYEASAQEIQLQVEQWLQLLHSGERITLDRVGYLFLDQEKNIGFAQDRYFNLLLQSYGLGKVHFVSEEDIQIVSRPVPAEAVQPEIRIRPVERPVLQLEQAPVIELIPEGIEPAETVEDGPRIIPIPARSGNVRLWRYVAAAALIPIAFYSYWIPMKTKVLESGVLAVQDFNPFHQEDAGTYQAKALSFEPDTARVREVSVAREVAALSPDVKTWSYPYAENLYMPVRVKENASQPEMQENTTVPVAATKAPVMEESPAVKSTPASVQATGNYHLITNCFGSEANAEKFVSYLRSKGFDAYIVDVNKGLHRVSAGKASSSAALEPMQEKIEGLQIEGSWILKK